MPGRKVIVCGVDGAGKSTFIDNYVRNHSDVRWDIIHCTRHTPNDYSFFSELILSPNNLILDRAMFGQFIYQTPEERKERGQLDLRHLQMLCDNFRDNVEIYYVYADPEVCLFNCKKDVEDSYYTIDYIKELDTKFRQLFSVLDINVKYYYNDYHPSEMVKKVSDEEKDRIIAKFDYSSLPKTWAVDYDSTIAKNAFPDITKAIPNEPLIEFLKDMKSKGVKLILWSNRTGKHLVEACNWCADRGLYFDAVNENLQEMRDGLFGGPRKVYADCYIDDKSVSLRDLGMEF